MFDSFREKIVFIKITNRSHLRNVRSTCIYRVTHLSIAETNEKRHIVTAILSE